MISKIIPIIIKKCLAGWWYCSRYDVRSPSLSARLSLCLGGGGRGSSEAGKRAEVVG